MIAARRIFSRSRAIFAGRTQIVSRSFSQSLSATAEAHKFQFIAAPLVASTLVLIGILSAYRQLGDRTKLESVASIGGATQATTIQRIQLIGLGLTK